MRFRARRDDGTQAETKPSGRSDLEDELGEECEALLGGCYLSYARRESLPGTREKSP